MTIFYSNYRGSQILSLWMMHAGCVFVSGIHPPRTRMLVSFESVRWNARVSRLELGLYCHPKEFLGNGVRTHVNSNGKSPLPEAQRRVGAMTLQDRKPNTLLSELFLPPNNGFKTSTAKSRQPQWPCGKGSTLKARDPGIAASFERLSC